MTDLERTKQLIADYFHREFGEDSQPDFTSMDKLPIAYTQSEAETHEVQVNLNIDSANPYIETLVDGERVRIDRYDNLAALNEDLPYFEFDELVSHGFDYINSIDDLIEDAIGRSGGKTAVHDEKGELL